MSATIPITRLRIALDAAKAASLSGQAVTDVLTNLSPVVNQGVDLQIEVGVFWNGVFAADVTNFASITLQFQDNLSLDATALYSATGTLDTTADSATWTAGTKQHGKWTLTNAQTNFALNGAKSKLFWLTCWATTTDVSPRRIPLCAAPIKVVDSGWADGATVVVVAPGARMKAGKLQVKDPDTNLYFDLVARRGPTPGTEVLSLEGAGEA